jgi:aminopeptidase N
MAKLASPKSIKLSDYKVPDFLIDSVELDFDLHETQAVVKSKLTMRRNAAAKARVEALTLDGEALELLSVKIDGRETKDYTTDEKTLTIQGGLKDSFTLECETKLLPEKNTTLEGLYKSSGIYCTQCEAQGFRRITYFLDRPDVMAKYKTTIRADKKKYPLLLSNGNKTQTKDLGDGRHMAVWEDPFKKPCYLFALVAGDLDQLDDTFKTMSGRKVKLEMFVNRGKGERLRHAMESLKRCMKWDEEKFGREYDLDIFMVVAVDDFNFGAMENKGLNIFNSRYLVADAKTATDLDFVHIEAIVGHEYFHNWTGNRITCRDWFQLSLKEGFTVFRDQEFTADMLSRGVKRVEDVSGLRSQQFPEDAGPMAHPVRPESYIEINNFYTTTVYEKGAELIRMMALILGPEKFRKATDKYFELFDGQAVTTDDFVKAMETSGIDLTQFRLWYSQAGTPVLKVSSEFSNGKLKLTVKQSCPATPGQSEKKPFHIPFAVALLDKSGAAIEERVLSLKKSEETFEFSGLKEKPALSLLRGFSAPVNLQYDYSEDELLFLFAKDSDPFARWEAGQKLVLREWQKLIDAELSGKQAEVSSKYLAAIGEVLADKKADHAFLSELIAMPEESYIEQFQKVIHPDVISNTKKKLEAAILKVHEKKLVELYKALSRNEPYEYTATAVGRRSYKNRILRRLTQDEKYLGLAREQMKTNNNHTDEVDAVKSLVWFGGKVCDEALKYFYDKWKSDSVVITKWFGFIGVAPGEGALERVKRTMKDPIFNITTPNHVGSLVLGFARYNLGFHELDGSGYKFVADLILELDPKNPMIAARLAGAFNQWKKYEDRRKNLMRAELDRLVKEKLSPGVYEIVSKALS